jgi:phage baseplate assembly protein W
MAFGATRIFPNDLRPRVAIGIDLPLNGPVAFIPNYQTKDSIRNNLINYLLTNPGERILNPTFGGGLRTYIFTQIETDKFEFIRDDLQDKIGSNFPDIKLNNVEVLQSVNENTIQIKCTIFHRNSLYYKKIIAVSY